MSQHGADFLCESQWKETAGELSRSLVADNGEQCSECSQLTYIEFSIEYAAENDHYFFSFTLPDGTKYICRPRCPVTEAAMLDRVPLP